MDHFGIGAALQGMAQMYFRSARQTGRTTSLVESVKDGDRIVFMDVKEANRVRRMCELRGLVVECVVFDPETPDRAFERGTPVGRTLFDHSWVEQYYRNAIGKAKREIDFFERQSSGNSEAHQETRRCAEEVNKWQGF